MGYTDWFHPNAPKPSGFTDLEDLHLIVHGKLIALDRRFQSQFQVEILNYFFFQRTSGVGVFYTATCSALTGHGQLTHFTPLGGPVLSPLIFPVAVLTSTDTPGY